MPGRRRASGGGGTLGLSDDDRIGGTGAWTLVFDGWDRADEGRREALCTLGNGRFATRGAAPERRARGALEVARFFAGLAEFDPARGRYRIRGVMGPDEYSTRYPGAATPGIDDNAYTNVLTVWLPLRAQDVLAVLSGTRRTELLSADELRELLEPLGYGLAPEAIPRTIEYCTARTAHGSTLSALVLAWVLARVDREQALEPFERVLRSDLADIQGGTTAEDVHLGETVRLRARSGPSPCPAVVARGDAGVLGGRVDPDGSR